MLTQVEAVIHRSGFTGYSLEYFQQVMSNNTQIICIPREETKNNGWSQVFATKSWHPSVVIDIILSSGISICHSVYSCSFLKLGRDEKYKIQAMHFHISEFVSHYRDISVSNPWHYTSREKISRLCPLGIGSK